jgi:hypothetical protein
MNQRTLIVGLGTNGSHMVDQLLRELKGIHGDLKKFPHVMALKIDTAKVTDDYIDGEQVRHVQLGDYVTVNVSDWREYRNLGLYGVRDWLTSETLEKLDGFNFSTGAGNYRPIGQFCMVMAAKAIRQHIQTAIVHLQNVNTALDQNLSICVFGFAGGGTCSGGLVTLLEAIQLEIMASAWNPVGASPNLPKARVRVYLSVPHRNFIPSDLNDQYFISNTVGLLQSLEDARSLPEYGALAATFTATLTPGDKRALVGNAQYQRLAHAVFLIQPVSSSDTQSAGQSISDAVLAQILADRDIIGEDLVDKFTPDEFKRVTLFSTTRATYPLQDIANGLTAKALMEALSLWTGKSSTSTDFSAVAKEVLDDVGDRMSYEDVAGIIRIGIDGYVDNARSELLNGNISIDSVANHRVFTSNVAIKLDNFASVIEAASINVSVLTDRVLTDLLFRVEQSHLKYPSVGYVKILLGAITEIENSLDNPTPDIFVTSVSPAEIEEVATDFSMQLNPAYRQVSYRTVASKYLKRQADNLGLVGVDRLIKTDGFLQRFRRQLKSTLSDIRHRVDNGSSIYQLETHQVQDASIQMIIESITNWCRQATEMYESLVVTKPNVVYVVQQSTLDKLLVETVASQMLKSSVLQSFVTLLTDPDSFRLKELTNVVKTLTELENASSRDRAGVPAPSVIDEKLVQGLNLANTMQVPVVGNGTPESSSNQYKFLRQITGNPDTTTSLPPEALSVIVHPVLTAIPLDSIQAVAVPSAWKTALDKIRDPSTPFDQHRTIYPSNQLGRVQHQKAGWPLLFAMITPYNISIPDMVILSLEPRDGRELILRDIETPTREFSTGLTDTNTVLDVDAIFTLAFTEDKDTYIGTPLAVCDRWSQYPAELKANNWHFGQAAAIRNHIDAMFDNLEKLGVTAVKVNRETYPLKRDSANLRQLSGLLTKYFC